MSKETGLIRLHRRWPLVVFSLGYCLIVVTFHNAVGATPWDTADSAGRTMEFNDRFSEEHYPMWVLVSVIIAWCAFRSGREQRREAKQLLPNTSTSECRATAPSRPAS